MVGFADETVVGGDSVGARLRSAREAHGLSLDDIAARTRVPTRHLKAIEEDAFDQLPAAPYSVGFAKAFADAVGLNREEIGREFRAEKEGYGAVDAGTSYASDEPGTAGSGGLIRIALGLLIVAAIAVGLWMAGIFGGSSKVTTPPATPPATEQPALPPSTPEAQPPAASSDEGTNEKANKSEESSSRSSKGDRQDEESGKSKRDRSASSDETGTSESSGNRSEPAAVAEPERAPVKTTRDLNEEAAKAAAAAAPAPANAAPASAPPVIAPPPPPASAPAAPGATP